MERKEFLHTGCRCGIAAAAMMLFGPNVEAEGAVPAGDQQQPDLAAQVHAWVVDFLAAVDAQLDPAARARLLQACGQAESRRTSGPAQAPITLEQLAVRWRRSFGEANVRLAGDQMEVFSGSCGCPLVGPTPERLSDTWCECAMGYMLDRIGTRLGRPVQVELREAIKRGGQRCHWVVRV
jgi:hypothetical protein